MISREERQHLVQLKEWSVKGRENLRELHAHPVGNLLRKIMSDKDSEKVFDNVDWLIALIEREEHRYGVKALTGSLACAKSGTSCPRSRGRCD